MPDIDVAVIGGGPAGSTVACLLKKYSSELKVHVFERDRFPRDHVGESQLPPISTILDEMGCWNKVEEADFPIKIGATYRWGQTADLWNFEFTPGALFKAEDRPAKFEGQRRNTAFQVDRAIYDEILLNHARAMGAEIHQPCKIKSVSVEGDRITKITTEREEEYRPRFVVDCTGGSGLIRRSLHLNIDLPTSLQNVAIWSYWDNAGWAITLGNGGTRVQVLSLSYGWIWFIPISRNRASVGLILPAATYKAFKTTPEKIYLEALRSDELVQTLLKEARRDAKIKTTKDWSFVTERLAGENWYLAGESAGFADPILAAGMTLAQTQAREVAYSILEELRGNHDPVWIKETYCVTNRKRISQHIRFADFWYSANGQFSDLKDHCAAIARDAGFKLSADEAFQWLGTGGFINDQLDYPTVATFPLGTIKYLTESLSGTSGGWLADNMTEFRINLVGAKQEVGVLYKQGEIKKVPVYRRNGCTLPLYGVYRAVLTSLFKTREPQAFLKALYDFYRQSKEYSSPEEGVRHAVQALEVMILDGWVKGRKAKSPGTLGVKTVQEDQFIHKQ